MRTIYIIIFLGFLSASTYSQDKEVIAEVYFKKAKSSLVEKNNDKVERYLLKAKEYFEGISKEEVAVFGANYFYDTKKHEKAKEYLKAFFEINKNESSENYKEMLLLYTYNLDALEGGLAKKRSQKEANLSNTIKNKQKAQLDSLYLKANTLFKGKNFRESLQSINMFFSLQPDKSSEKYQEMILLKIEAKEKLEIIQSQQLVNDDVIEQEDEMDEQEDVSFAIIEEAPVFPGCEGTNSERKDCFSNAVQRHFSNNFNADLPNQLGLSAGRKRVFIGFKIDKEGFIKDVNCRAPHPSIKNEVIRVIKSLPRMIAGQQRGKPVVVKYSLPFTLIVEGNSELEKDKN